MVHARTIGCVQKAEALISERNLDSFRYATLQLRMGIEYLFYELIPLYKDELPDDIITKWQPRQIIDALLECDPFVDQDTKIAFGPDRAQPEAASVVLVKHTKAVNKRLLREHYHRLGGYLHAPTDLKEPSLEKWLDDLHKGIECLRQYSADQVLCNIRPLVEIPCDCGRTIKRNRHAIQAKSEVRCPNQQCGSIFDVVLGDDETIHYTLRQTSFDCPYCESINYVPAHAIKDGLPITCCECERQVIVRSRFVLVRIDGEHDPEASRAS